MEMYSCKNLNQESLQINNLTFHTKKQNIRANPMQSEGKVYRKIEWLLIKQKIIKQKNITKLAVGYLEKKISKIANHYLD